MCFFRSALLQEDGMEHMSSSAAQFCNVTQCTHCRHNLWLLPASNREAQGYHQRNHQELEGFI